MAFAKHRDDSTNSKSKISGILETYLKKPLKPSPKSTTKVLNKSLDKSGSTQKKNGYSHSEIKPKNSRSSFYNMGSNDTEKTLTSENCDDFSYLDKIKKKIEKTLATRNGDKSVEKMWENDENTLENEESSTVKETLRKLQLKDAVNRQEIAKLRTMNEKLVKKVMQLEEIIGGFKQNMERDERSYKLMEKELSNERRKAQTLESKLKKINPIKTAQLFQEILVKNESLVKEKEELEELLKQMLLDKEMSRIKSPFKPSQISYQPQQQQGEVFFNANEPQRPYEISENSYNKANNSFSAQPNYEYLNDADDKIYSKSMHQKPLTVYEKLGGQSQISKLIDIFSEKALKDQRICGFFWNFDKATMKNNMKAFFNELFDGPERISREKPIQQKMRINDFHFDVIKNHLISSLVELRVGEDLREEVADFVEKSRKNIVFQSPRNITEKLGGEDQVAKLMDVFYEKVMKDQQICGLFWNFDAVAMKNNQKAFFAELFGESKNTNNENILYKKIRITDSHFDVIKSHLVKSLQDLKVPEDLVKEFEKIVENSRKTIVYKDPMTIFEKLGSQEQITKLMDNFNEKVIKDQSVCGFFWNFDKETMKINQKAFFHELLGEVKSNNNINDKILYKKMRISNSHFDSIKNHLLSSLLEVKVTENLRKEVEGLAENSRKNIVFTADNDNNNNLPKDNENNKSKQDQYQEINFEENNTTTSNEKPKKAYINETPTPEKNGKSILKTSNINNESPGPSEEESLRFLQEIHTHSAQRFDQSLYLRIGGFDKITSLVEKFYEKQLQDSRINSLYEGNDLTRLLHNFKYFLTKIFGGPDIFLGKSLKDCDPNMNTSNFYSEVSMENFRFAAEELMFPEENIEQMLEILNKKVEIKFVEPSPQTIYELLGGYKSIAILVETLYKRLNEGFYVDMKEEYEKMKQNQKFYITKILGGPDTFLGENGRSFWKDPWLMKSGVEKWLEILEGALNDMGVRKDVAEKVKEIFGQEIK